MPVRWFEPEFPTARSVYNALLRETAYQRVEQKELPYLPVEIGTESYAFKLVKGRRNFVLMKEADFCKEMECELISGEKRASIKDAPPLPASEAQTAAPKGAVPAATVPPDIDDEAYLCLN